MALKCQIARAKLARYVASLKESTTAEKVGTLVKAGYLASVKTAARNTLGNASFGGVEYLGARPTAVAIDYLHSVMRSAATFGKVKPHEYRQIANTLNVGGMARGAKGITEGVHKAVALMKTGIDAEKMMDKFDFHETTFKNKTLDGAVRAVFQSLEAQDKPFFGFAFQTSLYGRARLTGIREGLTAKRLSARTDELLANPTEEMTLGATSDAQYATFKNPTALSDAAASMRQGLRQKMVTAPPGRKLGLGAISVGIDLTIPFTKVASAIANAGIDYSPAGFAKALIQAADKNPQVQAQLAQQLSRATIGSGLTLLGYSMYANGTLTGSFPTNAAERKQWTIDGRQDNSVLIGGKWRSITWLGPLAIPMLLGANLKKFSGEGDHSLGEKAAFATGSIGKTMTEQSYLEGLSNVIGAMNDPGARGAGAVAGMVPIPPLVGQIASAIDPTARQTESIGDKLKAKTPFLSRTLPARLTPFGDEIKKSGPIATFFDITNPREDKSTPLTEELARLNVGIPGFGPRFKVGKQEYKRSPEQIRDLVRGTGPLFRDKLGALIEKPNYKAASDDDRTKAIETVLDAIKSQAVLREKIRIRERLRHAPLR